MMTSQAIAFDWQGHRGARGLYPENTIGAMNEALKWKVTTLELDVVISKDFQVVVSHEPWMNEEICVGGSKKQNLYRMTYKEIAQIDCGSKPHPRFPRQKKVTETKPLLADLLKSTKSAGKLYNVEIKSTEEDEADGYQPDYKKFSDLVVDALKRELPTSRFTLQSFDWRVLRYLHEKYPDIQLSALDEKVREAKEVISVLGFTPAIYSPHFEGLSKSIVGNFHEQKMRVIPWTVNTVPEMKELRAMGVDGIITDYPDLIFNP